MASIASGIAGAVAGLMGSNAYGFAAGGLFGIPIFINPSGMDTGFVGFILSLLIAFGLGFILTYILVTKCGWSASTNQKHDDKDKSPNTASASIESANVSATASASAATAAESLVEKTVFSPLAGKLIPLTEVGDEAFSSGAMGQGAAIVPTQGVAYAPFDGVVVTIFKTKHAIGLLSEDGVEILIHVGINTVSLKGKHFTSFVSDGDTVRKGDKLVEFDLEGITAAGLDTTTSVIVSNTAVYTDIKAKQQGHIHHGEVLITVR